MKLVLLSDTHCRLKKIKVPDGDLLIHSGDLTFSGNHLEINQELQELGRISKNFKYGCIFICGNHDHIGERDPGLLKQIAIDEGLIYLDHSYVEIERLNIFGSAYTPAFHNWAFQLYGNDHANKKWSQIPDNTNILITHGPAFGILDTITQLNDKKCDWELVHLGDESLYNRIQELKKLKLHVCGHIHDGYGKIKINNIIYVNASICTEQYRPTNKPIVINL